MGGRTSPRSGSSCRPRVPLVVRGRSAEPTRWIGRPLGQRVQRAVQGRGGDRTLDRALARRQEPGLRADPLPLDGGLGAGAPIKRSAAATAERDIRALVALADDEMVDDRTALQDLFDHARRVLVTSSR